MTEEYFFTRTEKCLGTVVSLWCLGCSLVYLLMDNPTKTIAHNKFITKRGNDGACLFTDNLKSNISCTYTPQKEDSPPNYFCTCPILMQKDFASFTMERENFVYTSNFFLSNGAEDKITPQRSHEAYNVNATQLCQTADHCYRFDCNADDISQHESSICCLDLEGPYSRKQFFNSVKKNEEQNVWGTTG